MNESLLKFIAKIFRNTPHFKGKYRIGKVLQKILNPSSKWKQSEFFIQLKNKSILYIDINSNIHNIPFWTGLRRDEKIINLILKNVSMDWVVLDIGANIGNYSIPIAKKLHPLNGKTHAFEPVIENYKSLEKAVIKNDVSDNIVLNKYALGDFDGTINIVKTQPGKSSNAVLSFNDKEYEKGLSTETINIVKLDNYINNVTRCDFIKVDIEGAEYFMIKGGMKFIEKFKPIIYGEFNAYFLQKFGFSILDVWNILEPMGYSAYVEDETKKGTFIKTTMKIGLENLLYLPPHIKNISEWNIKK